MPTIETFLTLPEAGVVGVTAYGDYLYTTNTTNMVRVNLKTNVINSAWATATNGYLGGFAITNDGTYVYSVSSTQTKAIRISDATLVNTWTYSSAFEGATGAYYYNGYIYVSNGASKIYKIDTTTGVATTFYTHGTNISILNVIQYNGYFYISTNRNGIYQVSDTSPSNNSATSYLNNSTLSQTQVYGMVIQYDSLYLTLENIPQIARVSLFPQLNCDINSFDWAWNPQLLSLPCGMVLYKNYIYIGQFGSASLVRWFSNQRIVPFIASGYVIADATTGYVNNTSQGGDLYKWDIPTNTFTRLITNYSNYTAILYDGSTTYLSYINRDMVYYGGYLYVIQSNWGSNGQGTPKLIKIDVANPNNAPVTYELDTSNQTQYSNYVASGLSLDYPNLYILYGFYPSTQYVKSINITTPGLGFTTIINNNFNFIKTASNLTYIFANRSTGSFFAYNGFLYFAGQRRTGITKVPISNLSGATQFGIVASDGIMTSMFVHYNYLYIGNDLSIHPSEINKYNLDNLSETSTVLSSSSFTSGFNVITYSYIAKSIDNYVYSYSEGFGVTKLSITPLPAFTIPTDISFDVPNTLQVGAGNLKVSITDPDNTTANNVFYWYSTNGNVYANTNIKANNLASPSYFFISGLTNVSYTISVKASNVAGNSNTISRAVSLYVPPSQITSFTAKCYTSGNITVNITDTTNIPENNISYFYYVYDTTSTENNNSGNVSAYTTTGNTLVSGTSTYTFSISGLSNKIYTLYLMAKNTMGNSEPVSNNVTVYTGDFTLIPNKLTDSSNWFYTVNTFGIDDTGRYVFYLLYVPSPVNHPVFFKWDILNNTHTELVNYNTYIGLGIDLYDYAFNQCQLLVYNNTLWLVCVFDKGQVVRPLTIVKIDMSSPNSPTIYQKTIPRSYYCSVYGTAIDYPYLYYQYTVYNRSDYNNSDPKDVYTSFIGRFNIVNETIEPEWFRITQVITQNDQGAWLSLAIYKGYIYGGYIIQNGPNRSGIMKVRISDKSFSYFVQPTGASGVSIYKMFAHYNYLYVSFGAYIRKYNLDDASDVVTYYSASSSPPITDMGLIVKTTNNYFVGLDRSPGAITLLKMPLPAFTIPTDFIIDASNTVAVSSGNLKVSLIDPSNTAQNQVSYWYSTNGNVYVNSNVKANNLASSPYFFISGLTNVSYTIYVKGINLEGNSNVASRAVSVYIPPVQITSYTTSCTSSGTINVSITDTTNIPANNVSYFYYLYDTTTAGNTNTSGNVFTYTTSGNTLVAGTSTYNFTITGLSNKIYTLYLLTKNTMGNSAPVSGNVVVLTSPSTPILDTGNIQSTSDRSLTISIRDTVNSVINNVYYWYSIDGGNTYANSATKYTGTGTNNLYTYTLSNLELSKSYVVFTMARNSMGNSGVIRSGVYSSDWSPLISKYQYLKFEVNARYYQPSYGYPFITVGRLLFFSDPTNLGNVLPAITYSLPAGAGNAKMLNNYAVVSDLTNGAAGFMNPVGYSYNSQPEIATSSSRIIWSVPNDQASNSNLTNIIVVYNLNTQKDIYGYSLFAGIDSYTGTYSNPQKWTVYGSNDTNSFLDANLTNNSYWTTLDTVSLPYSPKTNGELMYYIHAKNNIAYIPLAPTLDSGNTKSTIAGNLVISFTDTVNNPANNVFYWYTSNGGITYSNTTVKYTSPKSYSFTISQGLTIGNTYTISVIAKNGVGNSAPITTSPILVNSAPLAPTLDIDNIGSNVDGNLTIALIDTVNSSYNSIFYWYSIDNGNTYANTGVRYTGTEPNNRYFYTISGLVPNRSYTVYNIARNSVGNSSVSHTGTYYGGRNGPFNVSYRYLKFEINARFSQNAQNFVNVGRLAIFGSPADLNTVLPISANSKSVNALGSPYDASGMSVISGYAYNNGPSFATDTSNNRCIWYITNNPLDTSLTSSTLLACYDLATVKNLYGYALFANPLLGTDPQYAYADPQSWTLYGSNTNDCFLDANLNNNFYWTVIETVSLPYAPTKSLELMYYRHVTNRILFTIVPATPVIYATPRDASIDITFDPVDNGGSVITQFEYSVDNGQTFNTPFPLIPVNNQFTISNLTNGQTYLVCLRAVNAIGASELSNVLSVVPCTLPNEPTISKVIALDGAVEIHFIPPTDDGGSAILGYEYAILEGDYTA